MNCLAHSLEQWIDNHDYVLWYDSNHVIALLPGQNGSLLGYWTLDKYGLDHMIKSFRVSEQYEAILRAYFIQFK